MKSLLILCCLFFNLIRISIAQNPCQFQSGENGTCIPLRECPALYSTLRSSKSQDYYSRQNRCGSNEDGPLVCCSNDSITRFSAVDLPRPGQGCGAHIGDHIRLLGGEIASIGEYPWVALLEYSRPNASNGFYCGGVLINKHYILTAAHCMSGSRNQYRLVSVRLGEHDLTSDPDCDFESNDCADPVVDVPVAETIVHENYEADSASQHDDIALIRLSRQVAFTDFINPICLPVSQNLSDAVLQYAESDIVLTVAGFGKTENASGSDVKLRSNLDGVNLNQCNKTYESLNITLTSKQICAGGQRKDDFCKGDGGGAIISRYQENPRYPLFVAGIESLRSSCENETPGIYTRVSEYADWIIHHMRL